MLQRSENELEGVADYERVERGGPNGLKLVWEC
jgi:hypothetical protein